MMSRSPKTRDIFKVVLLAGMTVTSLWRGPRVVRLRRWLFCWIGIVNDEICSDRSKNVSFHSRHMDLTLSLKIPYLPSIHPVDDAG